MRMIRELLAEKTSRSRVQCGAVRLGALPMALHTRESAATLASGSRYPWDNFYHVAGIEREVAREIWAKRSEKEMFDCLAWLYDGFAMPQSASHEKVNPLPRSDNN